MTFIAADLALSEIPYIIKNSYHQSAMHQQGVIGGKYATIVDICSRLKLEKDRAKNATLLAQQIHRQELEDARLLKEAVDAEILAAKEAARASKETKKKTRTVRRPDSLTKRL